MEWIKQPLSGFSELSAGIPMECALYAVCSNGQTLRICDSADCLVPK